MADRQQWKDICRIIWLCVVWYIISSSNNIIGKTVLTDFQYPMTVTMMQLFTTAALSGPLFSAWGVRPMVDVSWKYYAQIVLPLAFGKFLSSLLGLVSILKVPVSYAHTVKGTMPLFTVILSRLILGEKQTTMVYLSLVPIICGVLIATVTEISFDMIGLVSALMSTLGFSLQNIFSKKVLRDTKVHHLRLLHILARWALLMFLPVWLYHDFWQILNDGGAVVINNGNLVLIMFLLVLDGILSFAQNVVAFSLISLVTPLTYSVCNATKRISVITVSLLTLKNPVTTANVCGMMLAILGVLCYNKAKYSAIQEKKKENLLPTTVIRDSTKSLMNGSVEHSHSNLLLSEFLNVPNGLTTSVIPQIINARNTPYT